MPPGPAIRTPEVSVTGVSGLRQIGACGHSGSLARQSEHAAAVVFNPKRRTIFLMVGNKAAEPQEVPAHGSSSLLNDQVRAPGSWGKEQEGRSRWLWLPDRSMNAIQPAVSCEASCSVTSRIPSGPTTWNVQGAVSRPMAAWRTRRKMYASASLISADPGLRSTIIAFSSS